MKTNFRLLALLPLALIAASCEREINGPETAFNQENAVLRSFVASFGQDDTKVSIDGKHPSWDVNDKISYFTETGTDNTSVAEFDITEVSNTTGTTQFTIPINGNFISAFHAKTATITGTHKSGGYVLQDAVLANQDGTFNSNEIAVAFTNQFNADPKVPTELRFHHILSFFKFSISPNFIAGNSISSILFTDLAGHQINGNVKITYESTTGAAVAPSSVTFVSGTGDEKIRIDVPPSYAPDAFYVAVLPGELSDGFSITCLSDSDDIVGTFKYSSSYTVKQNKIIDLKDLTPRLERDYVDLMSEEAANCYIITDIPKYYRIDASHKGNSTAAEDEISGNNLKAVLLWDDLDSGDVISNPEYDAERKLVSFQAKHPGNAVIALDKGSDTYVWSWHIWVCTESPAEQSYNNGAGSMMDRNLGAPSVSEAGLLYQWGRKDPFVVSAPALYEFASESSVDEDVEYPNMFIKGSIDYNDFDWLFGSTHDNNRWSSDKTINDPCPAGWKVPSSSVWTTAAGGSESFPAASIASRFGSGIIYPTNVYILKYDASLLEKKAAYWSSDVKDSKAICLYFDAATDEADPYHAYYRSYGAYVRCEKDSGPSVMSIELSKETLSLTPGASATLEAIVSPDNTVPVTWESSDETIATVVNGVVTAAKEKEGTCDITARAKGKSATCKVTVASIKVDRVSVSPSSYSLEPTQTIQLSATVSPTNATSKDISWSSDDEKVATVSTDGMVTAVAIGTCKIYATALNGVKGSCDITVAAHAATDLSTNKYNNDRANCYIISEGGDYKFDAKVKGCSRESTGAIASAEVLWETFGTSTAPRSGELIPGGDKVFLDGDGYVNFSVPEGDNFKNGNAVIAVRDSAGKILWSWHIWLYKDYDPEATEQVYYHNAGTMMDRNLGAVDATPGSGGAIGLHYQWGRKDPFPAGDARASATPAATTIQWPAAVNAGTIQYSIENPTRFMLGATTTRDWYNWLAAGASEWVEDRWSTVKTMFDPCPPGWRVPDGGSSGVWATAMAKADGHSATSYWTSSKVGYNFSKYLGDADMIWYPVTAYHVWNGTGGISGQGQYAMYWSSTAPGYNPDLGSNDYKACDFYFYGSQSIQPSNVAMRAFGASVRCLKEGTFTGVKITAFSIDKTSLTMHVGDKIKLEPKFTPENASNRNLVWSSSDKSVVTVDQEGNVEACRATASAKDVTVTTVDGGFVATCKITVVQ